MVDVADRLSAQCAKEATSQTQLKAIDLGQDGPGPLTRLVNTKNDGAQLQVLILEGHMQQFIAHMIRQMPGYDDAPRLTSESRMRPRL